MEIDKNLIQIGAENADLNLPNTTFRSQVDGEAKFHVSKSPLTRQERVTQDTN